MKMTAMVASSSAIKAFSPLSSCIINKVVAAGVGGSLGRAATSIIPTATTTTQITSVAASSSSSAAVGHVVPWLALRAGAVVAAAAGGGSNVFDLTRVRIRLEGLQSYGVVTALLMNAVLRLYSMTPRQLKPGDTRINNVTKAVFTVFCIISVLCGAYTTVVFSLLGLYSKSAIGMGHDQAFLDFLKATASFRKLAFDAFLTCLLSFKITFVLALFITTTPKDTTVDKDGHKFQYGRWVFTSIGLAGSVVSFWHWKIIMQIAKVLLFESVAAGGGN